MVQVGNSCSWSLHVPKALATASNSRALMCLSDSSGFHRPEMAYASQCASHPRREASVRWTVVSGCTVGEAWNTLYSRNHHKRSLCVNGDRGTKWLDVSGPNSQHARSDK